MKPIMHEWNKIVSDVVRGLYQNNTEFQITTNNFKAYADTDIDSVEIEFPIDFTEHVSTLPKADIFPVNATTNKVRVDTETIPLWVKELPNVYGSIVQHFVERQLRKIGKSAKVSQRTVDQTISEAIFKSCPRATDLHANVDVHDRFRHFTPMYVLGMLLFKGNIIKWNYRASQMNCFERWATKHLSYKDVVGSNNKTYKVYAGADVVVLITVTFKVMGEDQYFKPNGVGAMMEPEYVEIDGFTTLYANRASTKLTKGWSRKLDNYLRTVTWALWDTNDKGQVVPMYYIFNPNVESRSSAARELMRMRSMLREACKRDSESYGKQSQQEGETASNVDPNSILGF